MSGTNTFLFDGLTMAWKIVEFDIHFPGRGGSWPWPMHIMENNDTAKKIFCLMTHITESSEIYQ